MAARKTVIWFGNAGTPYGDFGLPNLHIVLPALRSIVQTIPLILVCVSNDREKLEEVTKDSGIECEYVEWSREECMRQIRNADVCIAPNSRDRFSIVKSANRLALALSLGTPVVATSTPAAEILSPYVIFDDWEGGIRTYLTDAERAKRDAEAGRAFVYKHFSSVRLADKWAALLLAAKLQRSMQPAASAPAQLETDKYIVSSDKDLAGAEAWLREAKLLGSTALSIRARVARSNPQLLAQAAMAGTAVEIF